MKKMLKVFGIMALMLGLVLSAAPYWFGMQTETAFSDSIKKLSIPTKNSSFTRGWLVSSAQNKINLNNSPIVIHATHEIEHGPLPTSRLLAGEIIPALAIVKTTLRVSATSDAPASLAEGFKMLPALKLETILDLSGNGVTTMAMDAATQKQGKNTVLWEAGNGKLIFSRDWKKVNFNFSLPLVSVSSGRGAIVVKNIHLSSDMDEGSSGYMFGRTGLSIATLTMEPLVSVDNINVSVIAQPKGNFVNLNLGYGVKSVKIAKDNYGPGNFNLSIRNLDAKTLLQFEKDLNEIYGRALPKEQSQLMIAGKSLALAGNLSRFNPELEVTRLGFTTPGGELSGNAKFVLRGDKQDLSANPMLLLTAIKGAAELSVPNNLAKALVLQKIRRDISSLKKEGKLKSVESAKLTAEAMSQIADEIYPQYLQEMGFGRWFVKHENNYQFSMTLEQGRILVNGAPLSPAQ